jgi:hypothetical protein
MLNGGQVIVDYLIREKVPCAFGLCAQPRLLRRLADSIWAPNSRAKLGELLVALGADHSQRVGLAPSQPLAHLVYTAPKAAARPPMT